MRSALYGIARSTRVDRKSFEPWPTSFMSDNVPRERRAVADLELLLQHLAEELGSFRRRAQAAESRVKEMEGREGASAGVELAGRVSRLERENEELRKRLKTASAQTKQMLDRVKFLRQQAQGGGDR